MDSHSTDPAAPITHDPCTARTELIRETAYALWDLAGRPHGHALQHWLCAEAEILRMAHDGAAPHHDPACPAPTHG